MAAVLLGVLAFGLVGATGFFVATALGIGRIAEIVVAAWVVVFGEVVVIAFALSPFHAVRRPWLFAGLVVGCFAALAFWRRRGRPHPSRVHLSASFRTAFSSRAVVVLGVVVVGGLAYTVALILGTPPNDWDSLFFHLARAAFWRQEGAVGYVPDAYFARLNASPPGNETALLFVLEATGSERLTGFIELTAVIACAAGVFALSRRVGLTSRSAALGGLLFLTLPVVLLQASSTKNDLVVASLLVAATVFLLETSKGPLIVASIATALAVVTKLTALVAIPVLLAVAVLALPGRWRLRRLCALAAGFAVGSFWYWLNLARTGSPFADLAGDGADPAPVGLGRSVISILSLTLDTFDLSGSRNAGELAYAVAAAAVASGLVGIAAVRRTSPRRGLVTGTLILAPFLLLPLSYAVYRLYEVALGVFGRGGDPWLAWTWQVNTTASQFNSWYGPLGLLLGVAAGASVIAGVRRRELPIVALVLAGSPLVFLVAIAVWIPYDPWQGRFFVYPIALSASVWGLVGRWRPAATAMATIGAVTAVLCLVYFEEKPSGVRLQQRGQPVSVWAMSRPQAQVIMRPEALALMERLESLPPSASVALALSFHDFGYPAFGPRVSRQVVLISDGSSARFVDAEWLVASPQRDAQIDRHCWQVDLRTPGGTLFRRERGRCHVGTSGAQAIPP